MILKKSGQSMNSFEINSDFTQYKEVFSQENAKLNLISKNDEKVLYEKHIYDSLSIKMFFDKYKIEKADILDIGCGGGFPCIPIAIEFSNLKITGVDSIRKKINSVENIKTKLNLKNLITICSRIENMKEKKYDVIVSRAVADLSKIAEYALPLLKKDGYFIAYKSKKALEEIKGAENILKKFNARVSDILEYTLPLEEKHVRNLIVITFV